MSKHALLSPSSSHRWLVCTPAPRLESTLPEPKRNPKAFDFSGEGTLCHAISEAKLRFQLNKITVDEYNSEMELCKINPLFSEELDEVSDKYVVYVRSQIGSEDQAFIEQKVDLTEYVPESFGSADCIIINDHSITVIDLKAGQGVAVNAESNSQLKLYALGAYEKFKDQFPNIKKVTWTIVQPRLDSISSESANIETLVDWGKHFVAKKAKAAWVGTGNFVAGDHCGWCRAKAICRERSEYNSELAKLEFREPALLTDTELAEVYDKAENLNKWVNDVKEYLINQAVDHGVIPEGFKLATTVTHRKIIDQSLAAEILKSKGITDIYKPQELKSLAQLEKKNENVAEILGDLVGRPQGSPKLVRDLNSVKDVFK